MTFAALTLPKYQYKVSILIPAFNEEKTIGVIMSKIVAADFADDYEIVVVDDGSSDNTKICVENFKNKNAHLNIIYSYQENMGKGAAIRKAIELSSGEILVIQDADLEYDPLDIKKLIELFNNSDCKVVYGSRNMNRKNHTHSSLLFYWGGILITIVTNILFQSSLTDEATGYKLFHASLFETYCFSNNDFAWEPEITAKILKDKINIYEAAISYHPRSRLEGKKISWMDGVKAIYVLLYEYFKK